MPKSPEELRREAANIQEGRGKGAVTRTGKDPDRVAGAKKAAATRKERYGTARPGKQEEDD